MKPNIAEVNEAIRNCSLSLSARFSSNEDLLQYIQNRQILRFTEELYLVVDT